MRTLPLSAPHFHLHFAIRAIEFYGIIEKVDENLLQAQLIADDLQIVQLLAQQSHAWTLRRRFHRAQRGLDRGPDRNRLRLTRQRRGGFQLGKRQQIGSDVTSAAWPAPG